MSPGAFEQTKRVADRLTRRRSPPRQEDDGVRLGGQDPCVGDGKDRRGVQDDQVEVRPQRREERVHGLGVEHILGREAGVGQGQNPGARRLVEVERRLEGRNAVEHVEQSPFRFDAEQTIACLNMATIVDSSMISAW